MKRRTALKILGVFVACFAGGRSYAEDKSTDSSFDPTKYENIKFSGELPFSLISGPLDYTFSEAGIRNIIIERKGKPDLTIPFSEIVSALEAKP